MTNRKADPSTIGLGATQPEAQGTTTKETGRTKADSSRKNKSVLNTYGLTKAGGKNFACFLDGYSGCF